MYFDTWRYVNFVVVKHLISRSFCCFRQYKTTIADWLTFENDISRISEITHTWLIIVNIYYGLFSKLIEDLSHLQDFKALLIKGSSYAKVVKMPASLSPIKGSCSCFFMFMKYLPCFKTTQASLLSLVYCAFYSDYSVSMNIFSPFIEIERPPQLLVVGIICFFLFVVGSTDNSNGKEFEFNYIF